MSLKKRRLHDRSGRNLGRAPAFTRAGIENAGSRPDTGKGSSRSAVVGKSCAVKRSPSFDRRRVEAALRGDASPGDLTAKERDIWFGRFVDSMTEPTDQEREFYANRRRLGLGVGMTEDGVLVYQTLSDE